MIRKKAVQKKSIFAALVFVLGLSAGGGFQVQAESLAQLESEAPSGLRGSAFGVPLPDNYPMASAADPAHGQ